MRLQYDHAWWLLTALLALWCAPSAEAQSNSAVTHPGPLTEIRVLDVLVAGTNILQVGNESVPTNAVSNRIWQAREEIDVIAIHSPAGLVSTNATRAGMLKRFATIGIPLIIVEQDKGDSEAYTWRTQSDGDGVRTVTVGTEQLAVLRRLYRGTKPQADKTGAPVLQTTIDWDTATGAYDFSRIELGLFGKRVWLIHEQRASDEESSPFGIQFKKEW